MRFDLSEAPSLKPFFDVMDAAPKDRVPGSEVDWYLAAPICKALGFKNPSSAVKTHCDEDDTLKSFFEGKAAWFVTQQGCYDLAMGGKGPVAKDFRRGFADCLNSGKLQTAFKIEFIKSELAEMSSVELSQLSGDEMAQQKERLKEISRLLSEAQQFLSENG